MNWKSGLQEKRFKLSDKYFHLWTLQMADTTSLAESSQAFFCAIADYLILKNKNLSDFLDPKDKKKGLDTFSGFERKWKSEFKNKILF